LKPVGHKREHTVTLQHTQTLAHTSEKGIEEKVWKRCLKKASSTCTENDVIYKRKLRMYKQ
jgi:hypothetical protein